MPEILSHFGAHSKMGEAKLHAVFMIFLSAPLIL